MNQPSIAILKKNASEDPLHNLLVAYDSSESSTTALRYAIALALRFGSFVTIASIRSPADLSLDMENELGMKESTRQITEDLESVIRQLETLGIRRRTVQGIGAVTDVLVQLAAEYETDLLLLGAYGRRKMDHPRLGSTAEYMLRSMPCAVLTVGPGAVLHERSVPSLRQLLYASSLPARTGRATQFVEALAKSAHAQVEIVHVIESQAIAHESRSLKELNDAGIGIADTLQQAGVNATSKLLFGDQDRQIVERAIEIHADLIVFGLEHVPGDPETAGTISSTICQAQCPVLTVPGPA